MRHYPAVPARGLRRFNRRYGERTFHNFAVAAVWILVFAFLFAWHYWQEVVGAGFCILGVHLLRRIAKRGALGDAVRNNCVSRNRSREPGLIRGPAHRATSRVSCRDTRAGLSRFRPEGFQCSGKT
jgi:hypothetical protein